ncbi:stalk domain-containing protein [Paenibacillus mesotrionivorans]|uniref:Stalk domain-containing protein n=1 Tax=Paenibacillus mesotrionivorans TaxID=3160968 RepID=A0ACC7NS94_9BACL
MHHTTKKTAVAIALALAVTGGGAAWAQAEAATQPQGQPVPTLALISSDHLKQAVVPVQVNGQNLEDSGYLGQGGEAMLPLRAVAEAMGFQLQWNAQAYSVELTKDNLFTTVKTGENEYAVNKMLKKLEAAPALVESKLYVPASFFVEVLPGAVVSGNDGISITAKEERKSVQAKGVVTAVRDHEGRRSLHIKGYGTDGVVLNVGEQTEILGADGNKLDFSALTIGMEVEVEHSMAMTMSLPPQTAAFRIKVVSALEAKDVLGTWGTIEEILQSVNGDVSVRVKGAGLTDSSPEEVVLRIAKDTVLQNAEGKDIGVSELTKGARVVGFYTPMLTKSLPPIGTALKMTLVAEASEA